MCREKTRCRKGNMPIGHHQIGARLVEDQCRWNGDFDSKSGKLGTTLIVALLDAQRWSGY